MSPRGKRRTLAPGLYADEIGVEAVVKHCRQRRSRRFPAHTPLATMQAWQTRQRALIDLGQPTDRKTRETTLAEDIARYLALLPAGRPRDDAEDLLIHWGRLYGTAPRANITAPVIHAQLLEWHRDGAAAQTCNHRRRVLVTLTKTLDGRTAPNPAKDSLKLPVPRPEPRGLPWDTITAILDAMRPSATKARLMVMAHTGLPHAVIQRLEPADLRLTGRKPFVLVRPRRKGAGVDARAIPVTPDAATALREFAKRRAFGEFSRSSLHKAFRLAAKRAGVEQPVTPYTLRHSFGGRAIVATKGNVVAVQDLMLHSNVQTTMGYLRMAVRPTTQAAMSLIAGGTKGGTAIRRRRKPFPRP